MITWTWRLLGQPSTATGWRQQRLDRLRTVKQKRHTWYKPCVPLDFALVHPVYPKDSEPFLFSSL